MSYCVKEGKDIVIFVTEEDHKKPTTVELGNDAGNEPGLIKENGDINWNCPCLGGMAAGPCGYEFRQAFSCFHYSTADPKGSDCVEQFRGMQDCMAKYPGLYDTDKDGGEMPSMDDEDLDDPESKRHSDSANKVNSKTDTVSAESKT